MKKYLIVLAGAVFMFSAAGQALAEGKIQTMSQSVQVGQTMSIGLLKSAGTNWYLTKNSNEAVVNADYKTDNGPAVVITGLSAGTSEVRVCTERSSLNCLVINVTVTKSEVLGASITNAHAAGTWVLSSGTVYYISDKGLIPVPTWKIFLANGGKSTQIKPANSADLNLSVLPLMVAKDARVK